MIPIKTESAWRGTSDCRNCGIRDMVLFADLNEHDFGQIHAPIDDLELRAGSALFAEATPEFNRLGATVIGVSNDSIETLKKFSVEACRNQFAVGADDGRIIRLYDAGFMLAPNVADRISYVIAPDGKVIEAYSSMNPEGHVTRTMAAVKKWLQARGKPL